MPFQVFQQNFNTVSALKSSMSNLMGNMIYVTYDLRLKLKQNAQGAFHSSAKTLLQV